jgi:thiol-disulfide isomerase/thioredoxin
VGGFGSITNNAYQNFIKATRGLQDSINIELNKLKLGTPNILDQLNSSKVELAKTHLAGTNFNDLYLKNRGEYYVIKLRALEYSRHHLHELDWEKERQNILNMAVSDDFFSYESLKAQRAGIRDFTHYYTRTFGIYEEVEQKFGKSLAEYDIKRIAYEALDEKRMSVIELIENPKARAYAELFLVAERIGEIPLPLAEPSYQEYPSKYFEYDEFTHFISEFFNEIKSVSPGEPAIPFKLYDKNGTPHALNDFTGKYVLLDFWAGWCKPCLEEFSIMREIYSNYSRKTLEIVGISTEMDSLVWRKDLQRFEYPWIQLYGGKGFDQETFKAYKGGGIPLYILIDLNGNIARYNDMRPSLNFSAVLDSLLAQQQQFKIFHQCIKFHSLCYLPQC